MARGLDEVACQREAIHRYILGIVREPAAAEDLTQETLLRAHRKLATLDDPAKLVPWLYRIATNLCRDRFRARASRKSRALEGDLTADTPAAESIADPTPRLDKLLEQEEMGACVQRYLAGLSDSYRAVILLHDVEGLSNPEIAAMLDASLATVKVRLHRARRKLRAALNRGCSFSTDERGVLVCDPKPEATDPRA